MPTDATPAAGHRAAHALLVLAWLWVALVAAHAQGDVSAGELVRQTVANEVMAANAGGHSHWHA